MYILRPKTNSTNIRVCIGFQVSQLTAKYSFCESSSYFIMTAKIRAPSLANFHCQQADRHMNKNL